MRTKISLIQSSVRRRKTKGNRKTVKPFVLVLESEAIPRKANLLRAFLLVSYGRAETAVVRETQKGNTKTLREFPPVSKERAKTVEMGRKKHATQGGEARGLG